MCRGIELSGVLCTDPQEIVSKFDNFFLESVEDIVKEITTEIENQPSSGDQHVEVYDIKFEEVKEVTCRELSYVISSKIDVKKGSIEDIKAKMIQSVWRRNSNMIIWLINVSLQEGIALDDWKTSILKVC